TMRRARAWRWKLSQTRYAHARHAEGAGATAGAARSWSVDMMASFIVRRSAPQQIPQHILRRFVERFEVLHLQPLLDDELAEPLEEAARVAGAHDQEPLVAIDADDILQLQQAASQGAAL